MPQRFGAGEAAIGGADHVLDEFIARLVDGHFTPHDSGNVQVDVLVDRSRQLGLDPKTLGVPPGTFQIFGPGTLNQVSGDSPASLICPTRFRIISAPEEGPLRDLLMIPDAVAYLLDQQKQDAEARKALEAGQEFWFEGVNLKSLVAGTPTALARTEQGAAGTSRKRRST